MINSMTGYAAAEKAGEQFVTTVEIRSYNSRHLDIVLRGLQGYNGLEDRVKTIVHERLVRGRIEIRIKVSEPENAAVAFEIDRPKATAFLEAVQQLRDNFDVDGPVSLDLLIGTGGILRPVQTELDLETIRPVLEECLGEALEHLNGMRAREGAYISSDLEGRLDRVNILLDQISSSAEGLLELYQARLKERLAALTHGTVELDPARVTQEAALLADRSDISEEIVRAGSHIAQFRQYMAAPEACGRKLNFLLQELNREFNTMGAKVGKASTAHLIVEAKAEFEKIREQVQNIE
jgi:uncharacterized protein (TIGR00255 family)